MNNSIFKLASGKVAFKGIEKSEEKAKLFTFSPADVATQLESEYFNGGQLSVRKVFSEYRSLRDMLFSGETVGGNYEKPFYK